MPTSSAGAGTPGPPPGPAAGPSAAWGTATLDELVNLGDSTPGPDFAALSPDIDRLAEEGDAVALGVLQQAAADLVESVLLVRSKLRRKRNITA
ncbi:MAG: hypothetical protein ACXWMX_03145, partial [Candidatus Limnocylindrales bacterium]